MEIPMGSKDLHESRSKHRLLLTPDRDFLERDRKDRKRDLTPGEVYPAEMEVKKRKSEECLPNTKRRKMEIPMGSKDLHESRSKHRWLLTPDRDFLERDRKDRKRDLTPGEVYPAEMEVKKRKSEECLPKPSKINRESELQGRKQRHSEEYERDSPRKLKARAHHYSPNSMGGKRVRGGGVTVKPPHPLPAHHNPPRSQRSEELRYHPYNPPQLQSRDFRSPVNHLPLSYNVAEEGRPPTRSRRDYPPRSSSVQNCYPSPRPSNERHSLDVDSYEGFPSRRSDNKRVFSRKHWDDGRSIKGQFTSSRNLAEGQVNFYECSSDERSHCRRNSDEWRESAEHSHDNLSSFMGSVHKRRWAAGRSYSACSAIRGSFSSSAMQNCYPSPRPSNERHSLDVDSYEGFPSRRSDNKRVFSRKHWDDGRSIKGQFTSSRNLAEGQVNFYECSSDERSHCRRNSDEWRESVDRSHDNLSSFMGSVHKRRWAAGRSYSACPAIRGPFSRDPCEKLSTSVRSGNIRGWGERHLLCEHPRRRDQSTFRDQFNPMSPIKEVPRDALSYFRGESIERRSPLGGGPRGHNFRVQGEVLGRRKPRGGQSSFRGQSNRRRPFSEGPRGGQSFRGLSNKRRPFSEGPRGGQSFRGQSSRRRPFSEGPRGGQSSFRGRSSCRRPFRKGPRRDQSNVRGMTNGRRPFRNGQAALRGESNGGCTVSEHIRSCSPKRIRKQNRKFRKGKQAKSNQSNVEGAVRSRSRSGSVMGRPSGRAMSGGDCDDEDSTDSEFGRGKRPWRPRNN